MAINALEASNEQDTVKIWVEEQPEEVVFKVWNAQVIQEDVARRIFQRNFSTKQQEGRGIGTFSMKILGEKILHGNVAFTSSQQEGTTFSFRHPRQVKSSHAAELFKCA
ncbi:MAG: ATP-binding protein [Desulfobulbaceae bacterium]|nr:ATP-binding protein [Desulfobulbaceae bacterium]